MVVMKLSELDDKLLGEIIVLYDKVVGGRGQHYLRNISVKRVRDELTERSVTEYRFGSRFSGHSKLYIRGVGLLNDGDRLISFTFYPNLTSQEERRIGAKKIKALSKAFEKAIGDCLCSKNLAVEQKTAQ